MFGFLDKFRKVSPNIVMAPLAGTSYDLKDSRDPLFAERTIGDGCFITPKYGGKVYSPISGTITMAFPTKHAYGIKTKDNLELMIHIGVDTVSLNGEHFKSYVHTNQEVLKGDLIAEFDKQALEKKGIVTDVFLLVTSKEYSDFDIFYGEVEPGDTLFTISKNK